MTKPKSKTKSTRKATKAVRAARTKTPSVPTPKQGHRVTVHLSDDEYDLIWVHAKDRGLSLSQLIRMTLGRVYEMSSQSVIVVRRIRESDKVEVVRRKDGQIRVSHKTNDLPYLGPLEVRGELPEGWVQIPLECGLAEDLLDGAFQPGSRVGT